MLERRLPGVLATVVTAMLLFAAIGCGGGGTSPPDEYPQRYELVSVNGLALPAMAYSDPATGSYSLVRSGSVTLIDAARFALSQRGEFRTDAASAARATSYDDTGSYSVDVTGRLLLSDLGEGPAVAELAGDRRSLTLTFGDGSRYRYAQGGARLSTYAVAN